MGGSINTHPGTAVSLQCPRRVGRSAELILFNNIPLKLCIYLCVIVHIYIINHNYIYLYIFIVVFLYKITPGFSPKGQSPFPSGRNGWFCTGVSAVGSTLPPVWKRFRSFSVGVAQLQPTERTNGQRGDGRDLKSNFIRKSEIIFCQLPFG